MKIAASGENIYLQEISSLFVSPKMQAGTYVCDSPRHLRKGKRKSFNTPTDLHQSSFFLVFCRKNTFLILVQQECRINFMDDFNFLSGQW